MNKKWKFEYVGLRYLSFYCQVEALSILLSFLVDLVTRVFDTFSTYVALDPKIGLK